MRGIDEKPAQLFSYVDLEQRIPLDHPLRAIRALDEICALPVGELTADEAVLFLWVTVPMALNAGKVIAGASNIVRSSCGPRSQSLPSKKRRLHKIPAASEPATGIGISTSSCMWRSAVAFRLRSLRIAFPR